MLTADGFDEAILGVIRCKGREDVACYDYGRCVAILIKRDKLSAEDACEHMEFNVVDAFVGDGTPAFLMQVPSDEDPVEFVRLWGEELN